MTPPIFLVGYGLAMLLRANRLGSKIFRTIFFLPFVVGLTTESYLFSIELQPNSGGVDFVLSQVGLVSDSQAWTVELPLGAVRDLVDRRLVRRRADDADPARRHAEHPARAARGGRGRRRRWWARELRITLPLLRRSIALSLIISVIGSFLAFNQFFILAQNNAGLETVVEWVYQTAFTQYHLAYATAMALCLVVVIGIVSMVQLFALRDTTEL